MRLAQVAPTNSTVLLLGPTASGKEIGDLTPDIQLKFLRVLQEGRARGIVPDQKG